MQYGSSIISNLTDSCDDDIIEKVSLDNTLGRMINCLATYNGNEIITKLLIRAFSNISSTNNSNITK